MKFLHAADLHIDSPLRGLSAYEGAPVAEMRGATRRAVENLVEAAISNKVEVVVVAGDVFDGDWKDYGTGLFWVAQLSRLNEAGIPVVCVAGNHDAASEIGRRLRLPPNVSQLSAAKPETKRFDHLDFAVIGQSYATRSVTSDLAATYPPVRLEFVVRPPLGAGPSPGSGRPNGHCSARHGPPCVGVVA